jgi:hypothetical protein
VDVPGRTRAPWDRECPRGSVQRKSVVYVQSWKKLLRL